MEKHKHLVKQVATAVKGYYSRKEPFRISHGSTNSTRPNMKSRIVDITDLNNVLSINARTALVEPNVPMDRLIEATIPHGLIPPVVMEFPGITVGGGFSGTAGESSSFKHGFFDRTIRSIEMVLADGEIVRASEEENADLFRGAAGAVGTLGVTTMIELRLMKAKRFVKTTYFPTSKISAAIEKIDVETQNPQNHYVDGILFSRSHGAVITGEMTDEIPTGMEPQTFSSPWDPWFYLHVENATRSVTEPVTEYIPLAEYIFRYDRGGFWVGRSAFEYMKFPFNRYTRWFLDDFCHTRMLYRALHASGEVDRYVVQDIALPYPNAEKFIEYTDDTFGIWPLWLCPLKQSPQPTMHPHTKGEFAAEQMLNIGLWGFGPSNKDHFLEKNQQLERELAKLGGMKWLYAHTYYTRDEFWLQFDKPWYENLRTKYRATTFPDVHEKVYVDIKGHKHFKRSNWRRWVCSFWPLGGVWGIAQAIKSGDWRASRNSTWKWK